MANYLRKERKKFKQGEWKVFNHYTHSYDIYTLDDLKLASATLPLECKDIIEHGNAMTAAEQRKILQLADLSMQVWGGGPNHKLPWVHMDDYFNEFFIQMVRYLEKHDRTMPGTWVSRCKFIGFDTCNVYFKEVKQALKLKKSLEELYSELIHLYPDAYAEPSTKNIPSDQLP